MATRREILENKLPKDVAEKAMRNTENYYPSINWLDVESTASIKEVLMGAFVWHDSQEGPLYWEGIFNSVKR